MLNQATRSLPPIAEMEAAYRHRDASYDGLFYLGVRTTGIFCRPSCPARKPLARNVEYFRSVREAMFAGFRPCKRCRPLEVPGAHPSWVTELLDRLEREPERRIRDRDLRAVGVEPERARRYFQQRYAMTFHAFARGYRLRRAFEQLRRGANLDEVAMSHGFESHSGFRDAFGRLLGQPPGRSRSADCVTVSWMERPVGPLVAGATDRGVCPPATRTSASGDASTARPAARRAGGVLRGNPARFHLAAGLPGDALPGKSVGCAAAHPVR